MLAKMRIEAESILAVLEAQLGNQPFLCGNRFSMADALLIPMLDYLEPIAEPTPLLDSRPRLSDYLVRMRERPSSAVLRGD
ncbi:glutathione S-transferase family protein [Stutzerimonas stutzeri]|uniref:glutathione S-transferase family protein n=2 Tax=Pseudomonadaceae TaxID=135621 RepID=UPI003DA0445F